MRIDSHQHFWNYHPAEYPWMDDSRAVLREDHGPDELRPLLAAAGIDRTISVQARTMVKESDWLLSLAESHELIAGVVGWMPLREALVEAEIERFMHHPKGVGVREVAEGEPPGFLLDDAFNRGVDVVGRYDLTYDILIFESQLEEAIEFVDRHPGMRFVVDHIAKPRIAEGSIKTWRKLMGELARRDQVWVKLSGVATEADWSKWTPEQLRPYFDVVTDLFGPQRLMFGSDWPVCTLATDYVRWAEVVRDYTLRWTEDEQADFWGGNATEAYRLPG